MAIRLLQGDCRETLRSVDAGSIQSCVTSPPYYGLRDYGTPPLVWSGDAEHKHVWATSNAKHSVGNNSNVRGQNESVVPIGGWDKATADGPLITVSSGLVCECGAWLGSLGLEPTPDLFIEHLVECFREVRRVLRDDATCWVNLGDSYSGSGNGSNDHRQAGKHYRASLSLNEDKYRGQKPGLPAGTKPKDLLMMPFRLAMALQADGWYLRSVIPWLKRNSMPESVTDRPSTSIEYVFLLAKSARYYYDADAVRVEQSTNTHARYAQGAPRQPSVPKAVDMGMGIKSNHSFYAATADAILPNGRNRRNADWFMESWQGLMLDEDDDPLALVVNPQPFKGSHFATFPAKLVEPMVKASTSEKGQCPECGAPWVRMVEHTNTVFRPSERQETKRADGLATALHGTQIEPAKSVTTGWKPSCAHTAEPVPQTVLDCFAGAGSTLLVADRLSRNAIGCELKDSYSEMSADRIVGDAPLFVDLASD